MLMLRVLMDMKKNSFWKQQSDKNPWNVLQPFCERLISFDSQLFEALYRLYVQQNFVRLRESILFQRSGVETMLFLDLLKDDMQERQSALLVFEKRVQKNNWPGDIKQRIMEDTLYFLKSPEYAYYFFVIEKIYRSGRDKELDKAVAYYRERYLGYEEIEHFYARLQEKVYDSPSRMRFFGENLAGATVVVNSIRKAESGY